MAMLLNSTQCEFRQKRKANDPLTREHNKRAQPSHKSSQRVAGLTVEGSSVDGDSSGEEADDVGDQTPSTPQSAGAWPSLKKTIPCTHPDCPKLFNRQAKLRDHLRYHTGERPYQCSSPGCERSFPRKTHLERHVKSAHTEIRDYVCTYSACNKAFTTGTRLRRHLATHEKRLQFSCQKCGQEFRKHGTLQKHIDTTHNGKKPYVCGHVMSDASACGEQFDKSSGLKNHLAQVHSEPKYRCTFCSSSTDDHGEMSTGSQIAFATYNEFQQHNRDIHPPTCDLCSTAFPSVKQLNRHNDIAHDVKAQPTQSLSTVPLSFPCPEDACGRTFDKKGNLEVHIRSVHLQVRPFVCGKTDETTLNNIHGWTGEGACMRDFKAKSHLEEHIRTVHLGMAHRHKVKRKTTAKGNNDRDCLAQDINGRGIAALLTGIAHTADPERPMPCIITGCGHAFAREYDFDQHLRACHGLQEDETRIARLSRPLDPCDQLSDISRNDGQPSSFYEIMNNDKHNDHDDTTSRVPEAAIPLATFDLNNKFWIGSPQNEDGDVYESKDRWQVEETEMRELIGEGHGWEDHIIVDPALLE